MVISGIRMNVGTQEINVAVADNAGSREYIVIGVIKNGSRLPKKDYIRKRKVRT